MEARQEERAKGHGLGGQGEASEGIYLCWFSGQPVQYRTPRNASARLPRLHIHAAHSTLMPAPRARLMTRVLLLLGPLAVAAAPLLGVEVLANVRADAYGAAEQTADMRTPGPAALELVAPANRSVANGSGLRARGTPRRRARGVWCRV